VSPILCHGLICQSDI